MEWECGVEVLTHRTHGNYCRNKYLSVPLSRLLVFNEGLNKLMSYLILLFLTLYDVAKLANTN